MLPRLTPEPTPVADAHNVVRGERYRITVLDAGLLRLEYSPSGHLEDRASQMVVNRAFAPAEFTTVDTDDRLEIHTELLHLRYDKQPFSTEGLSVTAVGGMVKHGRVWRFGEALEGNFGGTARTLDEVDGACPLEPGIFAPQGIAVFDDSTTVLLREDGWIEPRVPGGTDLYVFAYGTEYARGLRAFYRLTGEQPLLPRWALGNWWSRYHPYTAEEYLALMDRFARERIPFSVAVLDMDWHRVEIDPAHGTGWTGYSWNTELFPDPPGFLRALHERGLVTSLNVHPAEGVQAHEDRYRAIATRLGVDPDSGLPVEFDPADPEFLQAYFEEIHHPLEDDGVDLWWLDWQQGGVTSIAGLDPLWLLNHFHYLDSARRGRRPLTFSRYAGVGSHRYPVGFSGDTVISWASLDFQPYFTATASNIGYGWWSHDLGGHFFGSKDDELVTRWVQFGVFSPITRLHSTLSPFNTKEPWRFGEVAERVMGEFLRLRHRLVPYLYTMNRRAHEQATPLVTPVYYEHPDEPAAYRHPNEYRFGSQLLVAPVTAPRDPHTLLGASSAWLPPGVWHDVFTGLAYRGGRSVALHREIDTIPVLAPAGAILPLAVDDARFGTDAPDALEIRVYAGADGEFVLSEDADDEVWVETRFSMDNGTFRIDPVEGSTVRRRYDLVLCGFADVRTTSVGTVQPGPVAGSVRIALGEVAASAGVVVDLGGDLTVRGNPDVRDRIFALLDRAQIGFETKQQVYPLTAAGLDQVVAELTALHLPEPLYAALVELLTAYDD